MHHDVTTLIHDILHARRTYCDGCFVLNPASHELGQIGRDALSSIETVLASETVTGASSVEELKKRYRGMEILILDYLQIAANSDPHRLVPFLRTATAAVRVIALDNFIRCAWQQEIPTDWLGFVDEIALSADRCEAEVASRVRQHLRQMPKEKDDVLARLGIVIDNDEIAGVD